MNSNRQQLLAELALRIKQRGSQQSFADAVRISRNWLNTWLNGKNRSDPSAKIIRRVCDELGLPAEFKADLVRSFHSGDENEYLSKEVQQQLHDLEVWVISPEIRMADDVDLLHKVQTNMQRGVKYVFWSANDVTLKRAATALENSEISIAQGQARFIHGERWLNLAAWRIRNPAVHGQVFSLSIDSHRLTLRAGKGLEIGGALATEVIQVFKDLMWQVERKEPCGFVEIFPWRDAGAKKNDLVGKASARRRKKGRRHER